MKKEIIIIIIISLTVLVVSMICGCVEEIGEEIKDKESVDPRNSQNYTIDGRSWESSSGITYALFDGTLTTLVPGFGYNSIPYTIEDGNILVRYYNDTTSYHRFWFAEYGELVILENIDSGERITWYLKY